MKIGVLCASAAAVLVIAACNSSDSVGPTTCSNSTLKGPFAFETSGMVSPTVHVASIGVTNFDGHGVVNVVATVSYGGSISDAAAANDTYEVNSDCTGTIKNAAGSVVENFVMTQDGAELLSINHMFLFNVSSEFERIDGECSNKTIKGAYAFEVEGDVGSNTMHEVGTESFDGKSGETFHAIEEINNVYSTEDESGSYSVNSDCTGTETASNGTPFEKIIVTHGGAQIVALQQKPGSSEVIKLVRKN